MASSIENAAARIRALRQRNKAAEGPKDLVSEAPSDDASPGPLEAPTDTPPAVVDDYGTQITPPAADNQPLPAPVVLGSAPTSPLQKAPTVPEEKNLLEAHETELTEMTPLISSLREALEKTDMSEADRRAVEEILYYVDGAIHALRSPHPYDAAISKEATQKTLINLLAILKEACASVGCTNQTTSN